MMKEIEPLFRRFRLYDILRYQETEALRRTIESFDENRLLNTSVPDLVEYFFNELQIVPIQIFADQISVDQKEINIDVSQDPSKHYSDRSAPIYVKGSQIVYYVPYLGDKNLLYTEPSHSSSVRPRAKVADAELQFIIESLHQDGALIKAEFDGQLKSLQEYLEWSRQEIEYFNSQLTSKVQESVEARRQKLLGDRGMVEALGYTLRKRDGAPNTYTVPVTRKKIITLPTAKNESYNPEPALEMAQYEQILSIISNMVMVMERSPHAFHNMKEEDLRQHFLVQLNGQYEGQATGETFNYQGKTDILIRVNDKNIFIAECKFWKGEKVFLETLDQLLGYISWRDTKTAVLLFNRNKNFGDVVNAIPDAVKKHPNYKRNLPLSSETNSRYVFHQVDDANRELIITVMAFNVPGNE
jgi:hypothetical protein